MEGLTIKLVGENSINSGDQTGILSMQGCGLLTLTGEGSLNITAADGHAIYANTGSLLVKDTTVKVSSDALAVYADLGIEISNSTFESATPRRQRHLDALRSEDREFERHHLQRQPKQ